MKNKQFITLSYRISDLTFDKIKFLDCLAWQVPGWHVKNCKTTQISSRACAVQSELCRCLLMEWKRKLVENLNAITPLFFHCPVSFSPMSILVVLTGRGIKTITWSARDMTKPAKWVCAQRRLRSAWASAQSDQSLRLRLMGSEGPKLSSCGQRRLWSDWADAQADLSLHWAHTHFVGFVLSWLTYLPNKYVCYSYQVEFVKRKGKKKFNRSLIQNHTKILCIDVDVLYIYEPL